MANQIENAENTAALKRALVALKDMRAKLDAAERAKNEPIAIIGMGCRFPGGANNPELYWKILDEQIDVIREVPAERWNIDEYYDPDPNALGKMYVRKSGFIDNVDQFEPQFFGISPREVASMDPQQRLLLEVTWEALEYAGIVPGSLAGSQAGVFIGMSTNDYSGLQVKHGDLRNFDAYVGTGTSFSVAAGRISYVLGLHGPTLTLDTACSSSLVAVHLACQSLRMGQSSLALAGGVSLILAPEGTVSMSKSHALAPDGYSKTFDRAADGYARGEGCGVIVLKRLSDALADDDSILALIKGSAINHDGKSSGLTVPNGQAQQAVIRAALQDAGGINANQVHFVETHGTGTQLGDPIEVRAIAAALGKDRPKDQPLILASVKANIGHLEAAAGMAGIIKVVLAFRNEKIPAQVHFKEPNPNIDWDSMSVKVAGANELWTRTDSLRIAGINAFGFSGTNAHIVLEEPPLRQEESETSKRPLQLLTLSANDENALKELASRFVSYLDSHSYSSLDNVASTATMGRTHFSQRLAVIGDSAEQLREKLSRYTTKQEMNGLIRGETSSKSERKIAFLFTGQGAQYIDMGRQLYETESVFHAALEKCNELLRPYLDRSLLSVLYPEPNEESPINETAYTQPALFAIEYALVELWRSWGITPSAVMGHSVGEYIAACVAGLFSLEDGLKLIAERGRLMQSLPHDGAIAAVFADQERVIKAIAPYAKDVSIAAFNGPENIVISGRDTAIQVILEDLAKDCIKASRLSVSHAFHSPLMNPILDSFQSAAASMTYSKPRIAVVSNVTGSSIPFEELSRPSYWRTHIRQPVQFQKSMETLRNQGYDIFLEIGPQPTLLSMAQRCIPGENKLWLASLRQRKDEWGQMLESLATLYVHGVEIGWKGFYQNGSHRRIPVPTYPFQRKRYWFESRKKSSRPEHEMIHPLLGHKVRSPIWKGTAFETELSVDFPAFLNDHRIYQTAIVPGTAYIEMALAAANNIFNRREYSLADVVIQEALFLPEEGERTIQITISTAEADKASFEVFSLSENAHEAEPSWKRHASGSILLEAANSRGLSVNLDELKVSCPIQVDRSDFYQQMADVGMNQGPTFRGLSEIWQGELQALGQVTLPANLATESLQYILHPALLDGCFQLLDAAIPGSMHEASDKIYVPIGLQKLTVYQHGQSQGWAHVAFSSSITNDNGTLKDSFTGDIKLFKPDGTLIAEVIGLQIKQISRESISSVTLRKVEDWLYELKWQPSTKPAMDTSIQNWIIFADQHGAGDQLAKQLTAQGRKVSVVKAAEEYQQTDEDHWRLSPSREDHYQQLMDQIKASLHGERPCIIYLWSLDNPFDDAEQKTGILLREAQSQACGSILYLVQALEKNSISPDGLWLVTQNVHEIMPEDSAHELVQASVWGLARTIAVEYPHWKCTCVDVAANSIDHLAGEILKRDDENQIALRNDERFVARLERPQPDTNKLNIPDNPFELVIRTPGVLDALTLQTVSRQAPMENEVEIRVAASGLNFRDVLNALGMYPGPQIPLGNECAGVVMAVGEKVTGLKVGDEVIGLTTGGFRSYATIPVERVFVKPKQLSLVQAAAIPTTFLTAAFGLHQLAKITTGDRILIHAAAGGVGLAAVQLARRAGAEIFATAGSPEKRAYLKSLGVQHVFDSRSLDFAEEIMQVTAGKGVNIVLNSLADQFIPKSLSVLADGGCFLEMGKRDDWDQAKVSQLNPSLKYYRYDLGTEMVNNMSFIGSMLKEILFDFEKGVLNSLPLQTFPMQSVREAFRYMAQAKHIGKVVITQGEAASLIRKDGTYLITGGLGGLGLVTARWLVEQGARHIVLISRREPTDETCKVLDELRISGAQIITAQGDVSRRENAEQILQDISQHMPSLRGIVHEAGVLDDGVLSHQNWPRFERVMDPKVFGAWYLHELTRNMPLDFFILFSTAAAVLGSAGQGNYAAANSFLDGLAHFRRSQGLPAMSINWGAWAEVGMAAQLANQNANVRASRDSAAIQPAEGMKILQQLIQNQPIQVMIVPIDWNRSGQTGKTTPPLLRQVVKVTKSTSDQPVIKILEKIQNLSTEERKTALLDYAEQQVIKTLGLDSSETFNADRALTELGLDSLMAVELKNKIEADLEINIPVSYFLEEATVASLVAQFVQKLSNRIPNNSKESELIDSEKAKELLENIDQLSEDEVNALLNNLLTKNEGP